MAKIKPNVWGRESYENNPIYSIADMRRIKLRHTVGGFIIGFLWGIATLLAAVAVYLRYKHG